MIFEVSLYYGVRITVHTVHNIEMYYRGLCLDKLSGCPEMKLEERCENISCPEYQYFCHPMGCINKTKPCRGRCLPREELGSHSVACGDECIAEYLGKTNVVVIKLISQ